MGKKVIETITYKGANITFYNDGSFMSDWLNEEVSDFLCKICGKDGFAKFGPVQGEEFFKEEMPELGSCQACRIRQIYCG